MELIGGSPAAKREIELGIANKGIDRATAAFRNVQMALRQAKLYGISTWFLRAHSWLFVAATLSS